MQFILFLSSFDTICPSLLRVFEAGAYRELFKLRTLFDPSRNMVALRGIPKLIIHVKLIGDYVRIIVNGGIQKL